MISLSEFLSKGLAGLQFATYAIWVWAGIRVHRALSHERKERQALKERQEADIARLEVERKEAKERIYAQLRAALKEQGLDVEVVGQEGFRVPKGEN